MITLSLLTRWSRVLLEKLTGSQLVKFPVFYGAQRFITAFNSILYFGHITVGA